MHSSTPEIQFEPKEMSQWAMLDVVIRHNAIPPLDQKCLQQCCSQLHDSVELRHSLTQSKECHARSILAGFTVWYNNQRIYWQWTMSTSMEVAARHGMLTPTTVRSLQQCCRALHNSADLFLAMDEAMHNEWALEIHRERALEDVPPSPFYDRYGNWLTIDELWDLEFSPAPSSSGSEWSPGRSESS